MESISSEHFKFLSGHTRATNNKKDWTGKDWPKGKCKETGTNLRVAIE